MNNAIELIRKPQGGEIATFQSRPFFEEEAQDRLDLANLITVLRRRLGLFLGVMGTVIISAFIVTFMQTPRYTAKSQVVLNLAQEQIAPSQAKGQAPMPDQADRTDTEVQVIRSRVMAGRVADALHLVRDPVVNPLLDPKPGLVGRLRELVGLHGDAPKITDPLAGRRAVIDVLSNSLQVTRQGETRAVELSITTTSAERSAQIANEYARQYTGAQLSQKEDDNKEATHFLSNRLEELRAQAQADTQRVQQYRIANNLLSTSGASLTEQEISAYNQSVASARAQAMEDDARLNTARAQLTGGSTGDDVGEALGSGVVSGLRAKQAEVSGRLADLETRYGSNHPDVVKTRSELSDVNHQIQSEIKRVISNLDAKRRVSHERLESLVGSLDSARGSLAQNNRALAGLDDLQRRAQASQELYESYLNRYKEVAAAGGTERADSTVISWAEVPGSPSSPRLVLNVILGAVLGLGLGLAAAFTAEAMFSGLTTGAEVQQQLGLAYLGGVPLLSSLSPKVRGTPEQAILSGRSPFTEAFRGLRASIGYTVAESNKVLAVTSTLPKEGKSTVAACLARSMALDGEKVIVIDCDTVRAGLSRRLVASRPNAGLVEYLAGTASLEDVLVVDEESGVHVLPLAKTARSPTEPIANKMLLELIESLRGEYDRVILDTAPVLPIAETRLVTAMADATIFVARWRATPDHAIRAALQLLPSNYVNIAGVVLSKVDLNKQSRFAKGDVTYYYRQYQSYY